MKRAIGGFTLVEMLVVIVIIAILASVVGVGIKGAAEKAWRTKTRDTAKQLSEAWKAYQLDFRTFPASLVGNNAKIGGQDATELPTDKKMFKALNVTTNGQPHVYFEVSYDENENGLKDKWGNLMYCNLDSNYDGLVKHPAPEADGRADAKGNVKSSCLVWSTGKDPSAKKRWIVAW